MKHVFFFCLSLAFLLSCESHGLPNPENEAFSACGIANPVSDLAWLKEKLLRTETTPETPCMVSCVTEGSYQGQTVYSISVGGALCCPCAGNAVYTCEGELVFSCDLEEEEKITDKKIIWKKE